MNAGTKLDYDCDLQGAGIEFEEAFRLNPYVSDMDGGYVDYLETIGRHEEVLRQAKRAQELDPEGRNQLRALMTDGQYDRVIVLQRQHLELHPDDGWAYIDDTGLIDAYHFAGRYRESIEALQQAWTLFGFKEIGQGVGKAYAASGYAGALRYSARQLEHLYAERKVWKPDYIASWYARAGDEEQALKWIGIYLADNNYCWHSLNREPDFVAYHSDPRFQELVKHSAAH